MTIADVSLSVEEFLQQSYVDDSPAWEYIAGSMSQKPMPKPQHSRLQLKLAMAINDVTEPQKIAVAFPELRCSFGDRSIVPDIAVLPWANIPFNGVGELENEAIAFPPAWTIEILSSGQRSTKVIDNILYCLEFGCRLGWLLDPDDRAVLVFQPNQGLQIFRADDVPTFPPEMPFQLTVNQIFSWLSFGQ
ncbi:MAG: Uma2 family endonuclease [Limnothrix sp. RL_2_0]|nr:Uma2 family endonuclease [Limnothrix sp. RL_2_0]